MITSRFFARLTVFAALAIAAAGCATNASSEDRAMERAYELKAPVTGSRIMRKVDPNTGKPVVGYPVETLDGAGARSVLRGMPTPLDPH